MTAAAQAPEETEEQQAETRPAFAVLFELEGIAASARQGAYDILKSILKEEKIDFKPAHFSRYCLHPTPSYYAETLVEQMGIKKQSANKLAEDIQNGMVMHLTSGKTQLKPEFAGFLDAVKERGFEIGALSAMPEATASQIFNKLGLSKWGVNLFPTEGPITDNVFPRADTWLKIARTLEKNPRKCLVIASNNAACKAALSAGMSCIAVPDDYTSFQDFGGADVILDEEVTVPSGELVDQIFEKVD